MIKNSEIWIELRFITLYTFYYSSNLKIRINIFVREKKEFCEGKIVGNLGHYCSTLLMFLRVFSSLVKKDLF